MTSPAHIHRKDLWWLVPLAGSTGFLLATDQRNMRERIRTDALAQSRSRFISNAGLGSLALIPAVVYWWGWRNADDYARDSSVLTARALVDSLVLTEGLQLVTRRDRPLNGNGSGRFLDAGVDSSFPSAHAASAWSIASVLARRYPGWLSQLGLYSMATAVSLSRVTAREHFPSDVAVGSALGWLVGRYVSRTGGENRNYWFEDRPVKTQRAAPDDENTAPAGSPYVPMDSWVYDALDRLAAFGLIPSQLSGLRPWTRAECRRQVVEADQQIEAANDAKNSAVIDQAKSLLSALHREFDGEETGGTQVVLDSVYIRNGVIAGPPLNDSYHFGQTWSNDLGRPFGRGWNSIEGFQAHGESGRFFAYIDGEYQHAPGEPSYSLPTRELIAGLDGNPVQGPAAQADTNRFRTIEAYAGVRVGDFEFSMGKESLYWGPTYDAPLTFSDNAEPTKNAKLSTVHPIRLPGLLRHLGDIRVEFVIGKLGGQSYTWRPWFNAQKFSFKLTGDLELGFTRWSEFWGVGHPITVGSLIRNLTTVSSTYSTPRNDPGALKGAFDFRYRIPGLRNWLTLYSDTYATDDPSPLAAPRRAGFSPGLYLSHVPGIQKLDLRVEAASTTPYEGDHGGNYIYYDSQYHSSNTNYGYLLGNSVGRDGRAIEGWSTYHFSPRSNVQAGYRQLKIGGKFLEGGGTQSDASLKGTVELPHQFNAAAMFQYERFWIPVLGGPARNLSASLEITWEPKLKLLQH
ncbi:MAG TPA: capsule assembly Wzi family protein [Bryobacteraceae bacterium]|nr:capsule assembly Wzi family protein [Bryobacteraceae bacterium]